MKKSLEVLVIVCFTAVAALVVFLVTNKAVTPEATTSWTEQNSLASSTQAVIDSSSTPMIEVKEYGIYKPSYIEIEYRNLLPNTKYEINRCQPDGGGCFDDGEIISFTTESGTGTYRAEYKYRNLGSGALTIQLYTDAAPDQSLTSPVYHFVDDDDLLANIKLGVTTATLSADGTATYKWLANTSVEQTDWAQFMLVDADVTDPDSVSTVYAMLYIDKSIRDDGIPTCHLNFCDLPTLESIQYAEKWEYLGSSRYSDAGYTSQYPYVYKSTDGKVVMFLDTKYKLHIPTPNAELNEIFRSISLTIR